MQTIALLTGGTSAERNIAIQSAVHIRELLNNTHRILTFDFPIKMQEFMNRRAEMHLAIPCFHGKGGEDGSIQGFLKTLGIPFLFSDLEAHAVGMNKALTKSVAEQIGIRSPKTFTTFSGPCVIKPRDGGSSLGVTLAKTADEFEKGVQKAKAFDAHVLIEEFIEGDEFSVAVIDEARLPIALPPVAIKTKNNLFDFKSKYTPGVIEEICPAPIDAELTRVLCDKAVQIHTCLEARHLTRSDFIVDADRNVWFLETNTIPGFTENSLVPKAIHVSGKKELDVFTSWIKSVSPQT